MRGRSIKEFEDQLTTLKKENFNLKLRIYFLEERMGTKYNLDKESVVKQNIELLVRIRPELFFLKIKFSVPNIKIKVTLVTSINFAPQVEVESLRKEIQEKQELLCQAVKAMELEDDEHKKNIDQKNKELLELQQKLEDFEMKQEVPFLLKHTHF